MRAFALSPMLLAALPVQAADYACHLTLLCKGAAARMSCVALSGPAAIMLTIPEAGEGRIAANGAKAPLRIDRRTADSLSMSYRNTPDANVTLLRLVPATGRMQSAQLAEDGPELAEFTCKEAG
ncbi:hypothetical protein [Gemmobacter nectariphilus]|uniref:hypothetical protein n=1 Tax=Gemmobacter nectariphilus TaxID=220343 RepID=UPI0004280576|nr:hypothetical protein [Gemmobacter nectariphilus]